MSYPVSMFNRNREKPRPVDLIHPDLIPLVKNFFLRLRETEQAFYLSDQIQQELDAFLTEEASIDQRASYALKRLFRGCQEIFLSTPFTYALLRPKIGVKRIVRLHPEERKFEEVSRFTYLMVRDSYVQGWDEARQAGLVLDFRPFFRNYPKVKDPALMGEGISLLNRHLAGQMYQNTDAFRRALVKFLRDFELDSVNLLANNHLDSPEIFEEELDAAIGLMAEWPEDAPYADVSHDLRVHGFEAGWGATTGVIAQRLKLLHRVYDSADPEHFERLLSHLPLIKRLLMVSPHGWFAQKDVLGKPDTGGQVTYVLDQARALEKEMKRLFQDCGVEAAPQIAILTRLIPNAEGTTCDITREKVIGSENCWIIRVPFRHPDGEIHQEWVSRFHIWPYLEAFAEEAKSVITAELTGPPDLIVGHYSDGNLVAHRLASDLNVTHCAAVHALEKTKYLFSDMHWADMEDEYHWSCHFTADIISYNSADFIISSSYREIGGTDVDMGMFESYETFSMPGLYRVVSGMDPQLARYNIVPPGASEEYFFPFEDKERRVEAITEKLDAMLFSEEPQEGDVGVLEDPERAPIFAMSRLDKVKNLPGLVEAFGRSETLRHNANLLIMSSITDAAASRDQEEIETIHKLYELIHQYELAGHIRWCGTRLGKVETGEIYRTCADRGGLFAQPAFMETFGLTVIEAMSCGLPVVVTCFGGPAEIVVDGVSGQVVNPNDFEAFAAAMQRVIGNTELWRSHSEGGIKRVAEAFSWGSHAQRVLGLSNVYSYWNYLDVMNRQALDQYIHTLYHCIFRPRTMSIIEEG